MTVEQFIAILAAFTALITAAGIAIAQIVALRKQVDGRLTQLLELTQRSALAEGRLEAKGVSAPDSSSPFGATAPRIGPRSGP